MGQNNLQAKIIALETAAVLLCTGAFGYGGYYRSNQDFAQLPPKSRVAVAQNYVDAWQNQFSFLDKYHPLAVGIYVSCKEQLKR